MSASDKDMLALFKRDPAQGYELFKAACAIADEVRADLEKARGGGTLADVISQVLQPSATAVRKSTGSTLPSHTHLADHRRDVRKQAERALASGDPTTRIRMRKALRDAQKASER